MNLDPRLWWLLARSSRLVAFFVLTCSCVLGVVFASRVGKPTGDQAWLLSLHRFLGALFVVTTSVHLGTLVLDGYVHFGAAELFVPFTSSWRPGPVALGIIAVYGAILVEVSSLMMRRIPRRWWHAVHLSSYAVFALVAAHAVLAGSDAGSTLFAVAGAACVTVVGSLLALRIWVRRAPAAKRRVAPVAAKSDPVSPDGSVR